mgnify:CR=1 FL=1
MHYNEFMAVKLARQLMEEDEEEEEEETENQSNTETEIQVKFIIKGSHVNKMRDKTLFFSLPFSLISL